MLSHCLHWKRYNHQNIHLLMRVYVIMVKQLSYVLKETASEPVSAGTQPVTPE
jgi:hypothetical protein